MPAGQHLGDLVEGKPAVVVAARACRCLTADRGAIVTGLGDGRRELDTDDVVHDAVGGRELVASGLIAGVAALPRKAPKIPETVRIGGDDHVLACVHVDRVLADEKIGPRLGVGEDVLRE